MQVMVETVILAVNNVLNLLILLYYKLEIIFDSFLHISCSVKES